MNETSSKPSWMPDRTAAENWALAQADHDLAVALAQFRARFPMVDAGNADPATDDKAHLYLALTATGYADCRDIAEWSRLANDYKLAALPADAAVKKSNATVAARAIYLRAAITRLLTLAGAPVAMIADAGALLTPLCPKGAEQRAKVQKAVLEDPDAGVRGAARKTKSSPGQISNDRKAGRIATPTEGVWSRPV